MASLEKQLCEEGIFTRYFARLFLVLGCSFAVKFAVPLKPKILHGFRSERIHPRHLQVSSFASSR